ncbi:MAG: EAL domain-containing protein [Coprobacillus sp.]
MDSDSDIHDNLLCAMCIVNNNQDYTILYANEMFYSIIGYSMDDVAFKYKNHLSIFLDSVVSKRIRQAIKKGEKVLKTEFFLKNSLHKKWVCIQIDLSNIDTHNTLTVMFFDLSDHKNIEEQLMNYQKRATAIFDFAHFDAYEYDGVTFELRYTYTQYLIKKPHPIGSTFPEYYFDNHIIHPDCIEECQILFDNIKSGIKKKEHCDFQVLLENGEYKWVRCYLEMREIGSESSLILLLFDMTAEKEAILKYLSETMFYQAMLSDQDAYGHIDVTDNKILKVGGLWNLYNEIIEQIEFSELFSEFKDKVVHPDDREQYKEVMDICNLLTSYANGIDHLGFDFRRIVEKNRMAWVTLSIHLFKNPINNHIMALMYIKTTHSRKKSDYNPLVNSMEFDALTSLYDRVTSEKKIVNYLKEMKPTEMCTFVLIDVDDFNKISQKNGDNIANQVLVKISEALNQTFRKSDIIGRYSQDQFILLLKNYDCNVNLKIRIDHFMKKIHRMSDPLISVSMGVVIVDSGSSYERCFRHADIALFAAKHSGKSCYVFYHDEILNDEAKLLLEQRRQGFSAQTEMTFSTKSLVDRETEIIEEFNMVVGEEGDIGYLIDPENYDLICGNQSFYNRIGKGPTECKGKKCYELIHRRTTPCPFCRKSNWSDGRFYLYKNYNEVFNKEFLIKNKLIQWKNRQMVLAFAIDLSDDRDIASSIENDILESNYILNGIHMMHDAKDIDDSISNALDTIGHFFRADNVRMWHIAEGDSYYTCQHTWVSNDGFKELYTLDNHDIDVVNTWIKEKKWHHSIVVESLEGMLCHSYDVYLLMNKSKTVNQRWIELTDDKKHKAVFEINNVHANFQNTSFMESFIGFMIEDWDKRDILDSIIYASYHDSLTGLYNRTCYDSFVDNYSADSCHSVGIVCVNINGLSRINKVSGDNMGDNIIIKTSDALRSVFGDKKIFRLNGDEFIVAMFDCDVLDLQQKIKMIKDIIEAYDKFTVSFGYAWDDIERNLIEIVNTAVQVMQNNKRQFYQENQVEMDSQYNLAQSQLLESIQKREFEVWLQPKFDSKQNKVFGAEALIRYRDEKYGVLAPSYYIPALEENHLIRFIDLFVFEEVCKLIEKWNKEDKWVPVISLNFSRVTMMEENLIDNIETIFNRYHISKEQIEIEIVESYADIGKTVLEESLKRMKRAGYKISLDDFGTSFTNLALLSKVEVDVLKIDKSLIHSLSVQEKNRIILKNIIDMCNDLGVKVIAEGVETTDQRDILIQLGCHLFQGYLYDKPIEILEFAKKYLNSL